MRTFQSVIYAFCLVTAIAVTGCKKFLDVGAPTTTLAQNNVHVNNSTAANVITGVYIGLSNQTIELPIAAETFLGLASDELSLYGGVEGDDRTYYLNNLSAGGTTYVPFWSNCYNSIFILNSAIEGLGASSTLTASVKTQLLGEAYFLRAFFYFYLVNYYGAAPLVLTSEYKINNLLPRTSADSIYAQVIADLTKAQGLLSDNYLSGDIQTVSAERVRPNKAVATALLARVYLYTKQYDQAAAAATTLIGNNLYQLEDPNSVFLKGSREAIWQLQPTNAGYHTRDGAVFSLPSSGPSSAYPFYLSPFLLDSFYQNDLRRKDWVDSVTQAGITYYYPYKYKEDGTYDASVTSTAQMTEYQMVIRLAEMYLIRSESRLLGSSSDLSGALADLNMIRHRAGLADYSGATDKASIERELLRQRQVEFFTEWSARWLDLKRTGKIDEVMQVITPLKGGGDWQSYQQLLPIPVSDIQYDHNLTQTPGY